MNLDLLAEWLGFERLESHYGTSKRIIYAKSETVSMDEEEMRNFAT